MEILPNAPVTTESFRLFLNLNVNALGAKPRVPAGVELPPGLYWNEQARQVEQVETPRRASGPVVKLSDDPHATYQRLVRELALGSGGPSGRPRPYTGE